MEAMEIQDEERRRNQVYSVPCFPDLAHRQHDQVEKGERFRLLDLEDPYRSLSTGSMSPEQSCTPH